MGGEARNSGAVTRKEFLRASHRLEPRSGIDHLDRPPAFESGTHQLSNERAPAQLLENPDVLLKPRPWHVKCSLAVQSARANGLALCWPPALLFALLSFCGARLRGPYPQPVAIGASCMSAGGVHMEVEAGIGNEAAGVCSSVGQAVDIYRATFEERWAPSTWPAGLCASGAQRWRTEPPGPLGGPTGSSVEPQMLDALPHELRHVQLGPDAQPRERGPCSGEGLRWTPRSRILR
jgi:hypothetical protein